MARRWTAMLLVTALALARVRADADCLLDDHSCLVTEACPPVCCSGAPPRMSGAVRFCISTPLMPDGTTPNTIAGSDNGSVATEPLTPSSGETEPTDFTEPPPTTSGEGSNTSEPSYEPMSQTEAPTAAPPQQATDSVDAFQSTTTVTGSRNDGGGVTTVVALVGAVAACVIVVGAIFYKQKNTNKQPLEVPGSSYQGADGSGLTPDNRSLDGMLGRGSTDSMKQLPVLSMASREDARIVRLSSPFGNGSVRISSPAHRGGSNEDFAFAVDTSSRAGSKVNVNFVGNNMEIVVEKNGVVAL